MVGSFVVGEVKLWKVKNMLLLENGEGEVCVMCVYVLVFVLCKEFVFLVKDGDKVDWYFVNVC